MNARPTLIHLQMGQDVLYVVLSFFILVSVVLAVIAIRSLSADERRFAASDPGIGCEALARQILTAPRSKGYGNEPTVTYLAQCIRSQVDQPPIITLKEADGYFFPSGSAALSSEFAARVTSAITPLLVEFGTKYQATIIEVVGHTDEQPVRQTLSRSSMDRDLLDYVNVRIGRELHIEDNVGLGMARAAAIVRVLRAQQALTRFQILPLSGGQAVDLGDQLATGGRLSEPMQQRRRIEIRLRRTRAES
jgi:hypothetical protein